MSVCFFGDTAVQLYLLGHCSIAISSETLQYSYIFWDSAVQLYLLRHWSTAISSKTLQYSYIFWDNAVQLYISSGTMPYSCIFWTLQYSYIFSDNAVQLYISSGTMQYSCIFWDTAVQLSKTTHRGVPVLLTHQHKLIVIHLSDLFTIKHKSIILRNDCQIQVKQYYLTVFKFLLIEPKDS